MSRFFKILVLVLLLLVGSYSFREYLRDKVPSIKSDLASKKSNDLLYKFLKLNNKKAVFCDLRLNASQNKQFERDLNSSNRVLVDGSLEKSEIKYVFIFPEDGKRDFSYDPIKKELSGLFWVESFKRDKKVIIELMSIAPNDLKKLNNL